MATNPTSQFFSISITVGISIAYGAQRASQRPDPGDQNTHDRWRSFQHGQEVFQQAGQVRYEDGRVGRREPRNILQVSANVTQRGK